MYTPSPVPDKAEDIPAYLRREMVRLAASINTGGTQVVNLSVNNTLPDKPREGDVRNFAAGVATASAGLHEYVGGAWSKL